MAGRKKRISSVLIAAALIFGMIAAALFYTGILKPVNPRKELYPVRGVDVSSYQGKIDWHELAGQDIDFAFIKATEGSTHLDEQFARNWRNAPKEKIMVGAYHFFSFDSSGDSQAEWFIQNVGSLSGKLAPVVDAEYYGKKNYISYKSR